MHPLDTPSPETLQAILSDCVDAAHDASDWGETARHIPALARINPAVCGVAVALPGNRLVTAGAAERRFSIQSISKAFALAAVLGHRGGDLWRRVGREAAGTSFDSIVLLEREGGRPRNPFINAGALVTTDHLMNGRDPDSTIAELLTLIRTAAGTDAIAVDREVSSSEAAEGHRNAALAHYLASCGNLDAPPDRVLEAYFQQCAIEMTCVELARAGRVFAALPDSPDLIARDRIRGVNALMLTCGHYDGSGKFAFRVGLPGKSGVGGGILVIVPGHASMAVWSPGLDHHGNSKAGTRMAADIAARTGWSSFLL